MRDDEPEHRAPPVPSRAAWIPDPDVRPPDPSDTGPRGHTDPSEVVGVPPDAHGDVSAFTAAETGTIQKINSLYRVYDTEQRQQELT